MVNKQHTYINVTVNRCNRCHNYWNKINLQIEFMEEKSKML